MERSENAGFTIQDLELKKLQLQDRIRRLEADLKAPLDADFSEQAMEVSNMMILRRLLEVERSHLVKVNFELEMKKQQSF